MKKKPEISVLNFFLCLCVIFIHVASVPLQIMDKSTNGYVVMNTIFRVCFDAVPGFFMLSGLKMMMKYRNAKFNYLKFLINRLYRIIIPYIIWVLIYHWYYTNYKTELVINQGAGAVWSYIWHGDLTAHFYFIVVLAQFYALMPLWLWLYRKYRADVLTIIGILAQAIFLYLPVTYQNITGNEMPAADKWFFMYIAYWMIGCAIGTNYDKFIQIFKQHLPFAALGAVGLMVLDCKLYNMIMVDGIYITCMDTLHMAYVIVMPLFLLGALKYLCERVNTSWITPFSRVSYNVYLMHCLSIAICENILKSGGITDIVAIIWMRIGWGYIVTFGVCIAALILKELAIKGVSVLRKRLNLNM